MHQSPWEPSDSIAMRASAHSNQLPSSPNHHASGFWYDDILPVVLLEIAQIGGWLVFHGGHQQAVTGKIINLLADADMSIAFATNLVAKPERLIAHDATE